MSLTSKKVRILEGIQGNLTNLMLSALDFSIWLIPTVVWAWVAIQLYSPATTRCAVPPFFLNQDALCSIIYAINMSDPTSTINRWIHDETTKWISWDVQNSGTPKDDP